jgi:hypothetical protein
MQTKQVFVLLALAYAMTAIKNKGGLEGTKDRFVTSCPLTLLNVDVLRKLAMYLP